MEPIDRAPSPILDGLAHFAMAPFRVRTYTNVLFLAMAFPLGLAYFIFLTVGFSVGLGLTIVWIGLPILALVFAGTWLFSAFERHLAIHLLGAPVPPRSPAPAVGEDGAVVPRKLGQRIGDFFGNPVTWKGIAYLALKFPLGLASFVGLIVVAATSAAFVLAPFVEEWGTSDVELILPFGWGAEPWAVWLCLPFGLALFWLGLNLLNLLAWVSKGLATALLGSERFRSGAPQLPAAPTSPPAPPAGSLDSALPA